jgi:hypothetical protein
VGSGGTVVVGAPTCAVGAISGIGGTAGNVAAAGPTGVDGDSTVTVVDGGAGFVVAPTPTVPPSGGVTPVAGATGVGVQGGAAPSLVVGATLDAASGGTPSTGSLHASLPLGVGGGVPSLIFTYKTTPTTTRIVIVISGRMELIDRPP